MSRKDEVMDDRARINALYAAITASFGNANYEGDCVVEDFQLWRGAEMLLRVLELTDEQIGKLLFYRFADALPEKRPEQPALESDSIPLKGLEPQKIQGDEVATLESGIIPWVVEIDGISTTWKLNYQQAHLPAKRGGQICFAGKQYRISKIYGTSLFLTSLDSEAYHMNHTEITG